VTEDLWAALEIPDGHQSGPSAPRQVHRSASNPNARPTGASRPELEASRSPMASPTQSSQETAFLPAMATAPRSTRHPSSHSYRSAVTVGECRQTDRRTGSARRPVRHSASPACTVKGSLRGRESKWPRTRSRCRHLLPPARQPLDRQPMSSRSPEEWPAEPASAGPPSSCMNFT
jgi:hypothetical protein